MIDWYINVSEYAPESMSSDKITDNVIKTMAPIMDFLCVRLNKENSITMEKVISIMNELSIMNSSIIDDELVIKYNRFISIRLTESLKQICRDIKIKKILTKNNNKYE